MPNYDDDLLIAAELLMTRHTGRRGRLPAARIRRSISTTYYAIFHFLVDEAARRLVGTNHNLRRRRRVLVRSFSHTGLKKALGKVRANQFDPVLKDFFCATESAPVSVPDFARNLAETFMEAQLQRNDADYNLNVAPVESEARVLLGQVKSAIEEWRNAATPQDEDFKSALSMLLLLKGDLRRETSS